MNLFITEDTSFFCMTFLITEPTEVSGRIEVLVVGYIARECPFGLVITVKSHGGC